MKKQLLLFLSLGIFISIQAQLLQPKEEFTRADTLRGTNTEYRDWWDVQRYDITVEPDFMNYRIEGKNTITFTVNELYKKGDLMQIDLQKPMNITNFQIKELTQKDKKSSHKISAHKRNGNLYILDFASYQLKNNHTYELELQFEGNPKIAKSPPWDGGWVFQRDQQERPWMSVACQGLGASVWYPCKDYQGDEPDQGATLSIITPNSLVGVGNGRLVNTVQLKGNKTLYKWEVKNPINNYNLIPNIGNYVEIKDSYQGENGDLSLSYWVLDYNKDKAEKQFSQVKPMLQAFEKWMGPYPFYKDGYKLIETPYLGMEHQSGIAYGNQYKNGYLGGDLSGTGQGLSWDFIIVHESGHEWFGNNITTKDVADMWVHEGFTAYSETLFLEEIKGKEEAFQYCLGTRRTILNDRPIIGKYGVNEEGSGDMYYKAANMIHTIRMLMEDDEKFKKMIKEMNQKYRHQTVTSAEIETYISDYTGIDLTEFFNQYLRTTDIPVLEIEKNRKEIKYRWIKVVKGFDMPVKLTSGEWIYPTTEWKKLNSDRNIPSVDPNFLIIQR